MTSAQRSAVRAGCNLAALPADVRAELEQEKAASRERYLRALAYARRIYSIRQDRRRAERELAQTGELQSLVRKMVNRMISGGSK
jgi:hypothetical protein